MAPRYFVGNPEGGRGSTLKLGEHLQKEILELARQEDTEAEQNTVGETS